MGKMQQAKGRRGEEELRDILRAYGYDIERGSSRNYGTEPDLSGLPGVHIEVKRQEKLQISAALVQAKRDAEKFQDGLPAVFSRSNRQPWKVTMYLDDWLQLYGGQHETLLF